MTTRLLRRWAGRESAKRKRKPRLLRFYDPCFGSVRESLALPDAVRDAAESLDGARLTLAEALARLRQATGRHGGFLEIPAHSRHVRWYKPTGRRGGSQVFMLIRFK